VQDLEERVDYGIRAQKGRRFYRPVPDVLVGIVDGGPDDLERPPRLDAAIAEQADIPERIRAGPLGAAARIGLQSIDGRGTSREAARRDIDLNGRVAHPHVVRVDRHPEKRLELRRQSNRAEPAGCPREDFLVCPAIAVDRPLEQELGLLLHRHGLQRFEVMLGQHRRGGPVHLPRSPGGQALCVQRRADRDASGGKQCHQEKAHGRHEGKANASRRVPPEGIKLDPRCGKRYHHAVNPPNLSF